MNEGCDHSSVFQMMLDESILSTSKKIKDTTEKEVDIL